MNFLRKIWHALAVFGLVCLTAIILTIAGIWHVVHGAF